MLKQNYVPSKQFVDRTQNDNKYTFAFVMSGVLKSFIKITK